MHCHRVNGNLVYFTKVTEFCSHQTDATHLIEWTCISECLPAFAVYQEGSFKQR